MREIVWVKMVFSSGVVDVDYFSLEATTRLVAYSIVPKNRPKLIPGTN